MKKSTAFFFFNLFFSIAHVSGAQLRSKYYQELKKLKKNPEYELMFDKKRRNRELQALQRDIKNFKQINWAQRVLSFLYYDSLVVTSENMPQLYSYIEKLCKENNVYVPIITIPRHEGIFNAFAAKLFVSSGGIVIGKDLLKECSDEEIEAIIAHEIGHIKHEHLNNRLITTVICDIAVAGLLYKFTNFYSIHRNRNENENVVVLPIFTKLIATLFMGGIGAKLLIGKRFEREADEFACKSGKAKGLVKFFERLEKEEERNDQDFEYIRDLIDKSNLGSDDYRDLNIRYYLAKVGHKISKIFKWLYHKTRFGAHPSNKDRIQKANEYMAAQA